MKAYVEEVNGRNKVTNLELVSFQSISTLLQKHYSKKQKTEECN